MTESARLAVPRVDRERRRRPGRPQWRRRLVIAGLGVASVAAVAACSANASSTATDGVASLNTGSTPGTSAPASSATDEQKMRDYSKCMRDNGVPNFPDPTVDANGRVQLDGIRNANIDRNSTAFQDAQKACASLRQGLTFGGGPSSVDRAKLQDAALKYAKCLRDQGLTVKDPDFSQGPGAGGPGGPGGAGGQAPAAGQTPGAGNGGGGSGNGGGNNADRNDGQGGRGGRGTGFLARAMGLDENDPAVQAAMTTCQPVLQQAMQDAGITPPGGGAPGGGAPAGGAPATPGQ